MVIFKLILNPQDTLSDKEKNFKQNIKTLVLAYLCILCCTYTTLSLHFIQASFTTLEGKIFHPLAEKKNL
eukprot:snap_masked-scaffold_33-processed-gene-1.13-mRNA-1 protein AED:1.00 eAED:1.00 QI:0/0/0/0/1/1/2/0/69